MSSRNQAILPVAKRFVVAAACVVLLPAADAGAGTRHVRKVKPSAVHAGVLTYRIGGIKPARVRSAKLVRGKHTRKVSVKKIRKAAKIGVVRLPAPKWVSKLSRFPASGTVTTTLPQLVVTLAAATPAPPVIVTPPATTPVATTPLDPPADPPPLPALGDLADLASGSDTNATCLPAYGAFSAGHRPPACWRPYAANSPFNRRIPTDAPLVGNSSAMVAQVLSGGPIDNFLAGQAGGPMDWGRPVYWSSPSDPLFVVHCTKPWGRCDDEGKAIRIPDAAQIPGGTDKHMSVVDQATGIEHDFWQVQSKPAGGGVLTVSWGGTTTIGGDGRNSGATAAEYGIAAGEVRAEELEAGVINHALFLDVTCDNGSFVYPATKGGQSCADIGKSTTNAPPEGSRFQLNMSDAQIDALKVPGWKKIFLRAMAHYGLIVGDTGTPFALVEESGLVYTSFGLKDKWVEYAKKVGVPYNPDDGVYVFDMRSGVEWSKYLRVVDPCVSQGTC